MPEQVGSAVLELSTDSTKLDKGLRNAEKGARDLGAKLTSAGAGLTAAITLPLLGASVAAIKLAGDFEQTTLGFNSLLGSAEAATGFLTELEAFAAKTPFEFPELVTSSQRLLAFGFAAEDIIPTMTSIGDAVAGLGGGGEQIKRVTAALGQMQAKGKASTEELLQLSEVGIGSFKILQEQLGLTGAELESSLRKGAIDANTAITALLTGMSDKFSGLMDVQSQTALGRMSTLKDEFGFLVRDFGTALLPAFGAVVDFLSQSVLPILRDIAEAFAALDPNVQTTIIVFASLAAAIGPVLAGIGLMLPAITAIGPALVALTGPVGLTVTAVAAIAAAAFTFREEITEVVAGIGVLASEFFEAIPGAEMLTKVFGFLGDAIDKQNEALMGYLEGPLELFISAHKDAFDVVADFFGLLRDKGKKAIRDATDLQGGYADSIEASAKEAREAADLQGTYIDSLLGVEEGADGAKTGVENLTTAVETFAGTTGHVILLQDTAAAAADARAKMEALDGPLADVAAGFGDVGADASAAAAGTRSAKNAAAALSLALGPVTSDLSAFGNQLEDIHLNDLPGAITMTGALGTTVETMTPSLDAAKASIEGISGAITEPGGLELAFGDLIANVQDLGSNVASILIAEGPMEGLKVIFGELKNIALDFANLALKAVFDQLTGLVGLQGGLTGLKNTLAGIFGATPGGGGGVPSIPGGGGRGGGGGGGGGGAGGALGGFLGFAGLGVSIADAVIGGFQRAGMNRQLKAIEDHTRFTQLFLGGRSDQGILGVLFDHSDWLQEMLGQLRFMNPSLDTIKGSLFSIDAGTMAISSEIGGLAGAIRSMPPPQVNVTVRVDDTGKETVKTVSKALDLNTGGLRDKVARVPARAR